jgi:hypothetical protein
MTNIASYARRTCLEAYNRNDFEPVLKFFRDAVADQIGHRLAGMAGAFSATMQAADILAAAQARGIRFSVEIPTTDELSYLQMTDLPEFFRAATTTLLAAKALRAKMPNLRVSAEPAGCTSDPPSSAGPLEVIVKAMPARTTETHVDHDADGNITGAVQIERDMA